MRIVVLFLSLALGLRADDTVTRLAADALKAWQVPGVAIAVVKDGKPVAVTAAGLREHGKQDALSPDDVFPLASCTKAFTSTLIAQLADERKMGWDDQVRKHLADFHLADPNADAMVSIRDLLTHRTGVGGHDLLWYRAPWNNREVLKRITHLPLNEPFRGAYQYSTIMVMAAGLAAEKAAGQSWDAAVRQRIIAPLGMTSVTFTTQDPAFRKAAKAVGHRLSKDAKVELCPQYPVTEPNPSGSINLSIRDMAPWMLLHLGRGEYQGKRLVSAENLAVTHSPQIPIPMDAGMKAFHPETVQLSYGMGWIISDYRGLRVLSHGGLIDGFRTQVLLVPDCGLGIALFNNLHDTKMNQALGNALVDHFLHLPPIDWNAKLLKAVADERLDVEAQQRLVLAGRKTMKPRLRPLADYAGDYTNPAYGDAALTVKGDGLVWKWSSFETPLEYWGDEYFRFTDGHLEDRFIGFHVGERGVEYLIFEGQRFERKR